MTVRLGVVGTGFIARQHLDHLVADPEAAVAALCDTDDAAIEAARAEVLARADPTGPGAKALADARAYADARDLVEAEDVDALWVCLPPYAHGDAEMAAVDAGIGLFVEKPVALDLGLARRVAARARAAGVVAASGYQSRYSEVAARARALLEGRRVGMALAHRFTRVPPKAWYRRQALSGGQVTEMATHQIDLLRCLVGEVATVFSAGGRVLATGDPDDVLDVQTATLAFANGAVGAVAANLISGHGTPAHARGIHVFADGRTVSIIGHEGERRTVEAVDADGRRDWTYADASQAAQARAFVRAVRDGRPDAVASSYENGVRTLAVTLAMHRSCETGQPVDVAGH